MERLFLQFDNLKRYPNGEKTGKKLAQVYNLGLDPEGEHLLPSIHHVIRIVANRGEEELLGRSFYDVTQEGRVIQPFIDAIKDSSDDEWNKFKRVAGVESVEDYQTEVKKLIQFGSGLIKSEELKEWILGESQQTGNPEARK